MQYTRWFKYDRDKLWLVSTQIVPVIFEPPCIISTAAYNVTLNLCSLGAIYQRGICGLFHIQSSFSHKLWSAHMARNQLPKCCLSLCVFRNIHFLGFNRRMCLNRTAVAARKKSVSTIESFGTDGLVFLFPTQCQASWAMETLMKRNVSLF
jgi:hypothetical protein